MYFDTSILHSRHAPLFQRFLPKLGSQTHFNTMCVLLTAKIVADTNQLKELRKFLRAGNEDSIMVLFVAAKGVEESKSKIKNGILKK